MNATVKRLLAIAAVLLLFVYVGYQGYMLLATPLKTETAMPTAAYQTINTTGVVYRDEAVISQRPQGQLFYTVQNGGRVSRDGKIADVYATEQDALTERELEELDAAIASLESINAQGTTNRANLTAINQQIDATWLSVTVAAQTGAVGDIDELHAKLLTLLNKKQITIGRVENFDEQIAALRAQREALAQSFHAATSSVSAPEAGYFINTLDGYESVCTTEGVAELTVADVKKTLEYQPTSSGNGIGKVVADYEWYLACVLPMDKAADLKLGSTLEVLMPFVSSDAIPMTVETVNKDSSGEAVLVLRCTRMDQALSTVRIEDVEIRLQQFDGIRVPDSAMYFNENQEPGVYVQAGNVLRFRRIRVLYHDTNDKFVVCEITEETGYMQLYDRIVLKGENLYDGKPVR